MGPGFPRGALGLKGAIKGDRESLGVSVEGKSLSGGMTTEFLKSNTSRSLRSGGGGCRLVTKI